MVAGKNISNGFAPFNNDDIIGVGEVFGKVIGHEAWVGETVKIVVNKTATLREGVRFGNGKTGAGDGFGNAET